MSGGITVNTMVKQKPPEMDDVFRALADRTRREILFRVARADCTVAQLSKPFNISAPAISRHLRVLEHAGILQRVRAGKHHRFHLNPRPLAEVRATLEQLTSFWLQRLDALENFLAQEKTHSKQKSI
jgi:DNA-binding transcriptional ArsR family regulator